LTLFAGVDGGQTATVAVVADESGTILGRGGAGPADDVGRARGVAHTADAIDSAIAAALGAAGLPRDTPLRAVVAGVSGFDDSQDAVVVPLRTRADRVVVEHDATAAHRGAFAGGPGVLVVAGSGSAALGVGVDGTRVLAGGWGFLFGDEGSAFWLARRAISAAMRSDDRGVATALGAAVVRHFVVGSLRAVQHGFADGTITRAAVAGFARTVCEAAHHGDAQAAELRDEAANALAVLGEVAHLRLRGTSPDVFSYHGGLFADPALHERWTLEIVERIPAARVVPPRYDAPVGALLHAYDLVLSDGRVPAVRETPHA
jgi:glucosamine kinase